MGFNTGRLLQKSGGFIVGMCQCVAMTSTSHSRRMISCLYGDPHVSRTVTSQQFHQVHHHHHHMVYMPLHHYKHWLCSNSTHLVIVIIVIIIIIIIIITMSTISICCPWFHLVIITWRCSIYICTQGCLMTMNITFLNVKWQYRLSHSCSHIAVLSSNDDDNDDDDR